MKSLSVVIPGSGPSSAPGIVATATVAVEPTPVPAPAPTSQATPVPEPSPLFLLVGALALVFLLKRGGGNRGS